MHLAIIGDNRPRLYWSMLAARGARRHSGADVPGRARGGVRLRAERRRRSSTRSSRTRSRSTSCVEAAPQVPTLAHIYYDDPRGLRNYDGRHRATNELTRVGTGVRPRASGILRRAKSRRAAPTTCRSCCTRRARRASRRACARRTRRSSPPRRAARVRPPHGRTTASSRTCRWRGWAITCSRTRNGCTPGFTINCPESGDTVMTDLREIGPTYYFAPPRVFENLLTQVMIRMEDASAIKRWLFHYFTGVARRCGAEILDGKPVGARRPAAVRARQSAGLRTASQRARHEPHPRRLHGGRRDRPRSRSASTARSAINLKQLYGSDRDLRVRLPAARSAA